MDFVLELLLDIILEGCIETAEEKRVPVILRIICAALLILFYCGLVGILLFAAIENKSGLMLFITVFIALIFLFAFVYKYREIKKNK